MADVNEQRCAELRADIAGKLDIAEGANIANAIDRLIRERIAQAQPAAQVPTVAEKPKPRAKGKAGVK